LDEEKPTQKKLRNRLVDGALAFNDASSTLCAAASCKHCDTRRPPLSPQNKYNQHDIAYGCCVITMVSPTTYNKNLNKQPTSSESWSNCCSF
jgi:hypothetical protein